MNASEIVAHARSIVGTPYKHQGRIGGVGVDCAGVPVFVGQQLGLDLQDYTRYGRLPVPSEMRAALNRNLSRVRKQDMQIGDVAWIRFKDEPQHLAIIGDYYLGGFSLIHAYNSSGIKRVVEHRMDDVWRDRIVAVWRYPGAEV